MLCESCTFIGLTYVSGAEFYVCAYDQHNNHYDPLFNKFYESNKKECDCYKYFAYRNVINFTNIKL